MRREGMGRRVTYAAGRRQLAFAHDFGFLSRGRRLRAQFLRAPLRREDAQRGRALRCTYGLAAVREENERFKDWFMRRAYGPRIEPVRYELGMLVGDEIDMPS